MCWAIPQTTIAFLPDVSVDRLPPGGRLAAVGQKSYPTGRPCQRDQDGSTPPLLVLPGGMEKQPALEQRFPRRGFCRQVRRTRPHEAGCRPKSDKSLVYVHSYVARRQSRGRVRRTTGIRSLGQWLMVFLFPPPLSHRYSWQHPCGGVEPDGRRSPNNRRRRRARPPAPAPRASRPGNSRTTVLRA